MKKKFKLFSKKGVIFAIIIALIVACFASFTSVIATTYGEGEKHLNVGINNDEGFALNQVTVNGSLWEKQEDEYRTDDGKYNINITVSKNGDKVPDIQWGGNWNDYITKETAISNDGNTYTYTLNVSDDEQQGFLGLSIIAKQEQPGVPEGGEQPGGDPQEPGARKYSVDFGAGEWNIDGVIVSAVVEFQNILNNGPIEIEDRDRIKLNNFNPETMLIEIEAADGFKSKLSLVSNDETTLQSADADGLPDSFVFRVIKGQTDGENPGEDNNQNKPKEPIDFDIKFTNTHVNIWVNGINVVQTEGNDDETQFIGTINNAGTTDSNETNTLRFQTEFGDFPVKEYTINGVVYKEGDESVTVRNDEFTVIVPGAEKYIITGEGDSNAVIERTIIWTNPNYVPKDAEDEEWIQEFKLENGYAYVIAVYDEDGKLIDSDNYKSENWVENQNGGGVGSNGFGWIAIYPGSRVIFEFVPEYGYQLTDIRINGQKLGVSGLMNQFEFVMPNTNIHFDAEFTKTEDILKTNTNKVSSGAISLGKNELDGGSAQLRVNDAELSTDKIAGFENAAGDYNISNYLDIDLYQVFYKGKNDSDDVWSNQIDELNNEVTITIKLADGVDGNDIVIVHNIHNGDKYEIIKIDSYDPTTNTITFKTKSFSNYAIASRTTENNADEDDETNDEESTEKEDNTEKENDTEKENNTDKEDNTKNPQTGDKILFATAIFAFAIAVIAITTKKRRNK